MRHRAYLSLMLLTLFAGQGAAASDAPIEVPSGQPVQLQEVLIDDLGAETWLRFRFIAPQIAREGGTVDYAQAEMDFEYLCEALALPYMSDFELEGDVIVVSLSGPPNSVSPTPKRPNFSKLFGSLMKSVSGKVCDADTRYGAFVGGIFAD
jgi:hypothetical protein